MIKSNSKESLKSRIPKSVDINDKNIVLNKKSGEYESTLKTHELQQ